MTLTCIMAFCLSMAILTASGEMPATSPLNPVLAGADPHVVLVEDTLLLYPTHYADGQARLYAYASTNLSEWEQHGPVITLDDIGWIKDDGAEVHQLWAPAVAEKDGRYYIYFSVGPQNPTPSRIGVAVADGPAGPFVDSGRPLLTGGDGFEAIDPMVFTDPVSGVSYLYAGGSAGATLRVRLIEQLDPGTYRARLEFNIRGVRARALSPRIRVA